MPNCLCLLYHRVSNNSNMYGISVSESNFFSQMRFVSEAYKCLRFEEDYSGEDRRQVMITFDDGYADNYMYATPILEECGVPATIFVTSGNIETRREFWWDELQRLVFSSTKKRFHLVDSLYEYEWVLKNTKDRIALVRDLRHLLRLDYSFARWEEWRRQLLVWSGSEEDGREENRSLSVDELRKLAKNSLITIGGHTVSHRSLGGLSESEQRFEILSNKKWLEKTINKEITTFSYPFGTAWDYNQDTIQILKEVGIKKAATTERRGIEPTDSKYLIPRVSIGDVGEKEFAEILEKEFARQ